MAKKVCVIEVNEVPIKVWQKYCDTYPGSTVARLFSEGKLYRTVADDVSEDFLYPSQTWGSLNTGLPYATHGIHWYNDPKDDMNQFWWHQAAAIGRRVGLVNVLHTSPLNNLLNKANYEFLVPDCFASDCATYPARYEQFQSLNLQLTQKNGRASRLGKDDLLALGRHAMASPASFGVSPFSLKETARAFPQIWQSRERLRNLQFLPLASIFFNLMQKHDPDIGVMFTNHIAAAQHRYWYALFPSDYAETLYPPSWVERYRLDVLNAIGLLDRYLKKLAVFCAKSDRPLIIVSSMGQHANATLKRDEISNATHFYRLDEPMKFLSILVNRSQARFERAMVPQYTYYFPDPASLHSAVQVMSEFIELNPELDGSRIDITGTALTLTLTIKGSPRSLLIGTKRIPIEDFGLRMLEVDDHHSGCHHPDGTLLVWNDKRDELFCTRSTPEAFSYLNYAQELRRFFDLPSPLLKDEQAAPLPPISIQFSDARHV